MPADDVEVVIPWRGGCPHREAALKSVRSLYSRAGYRARIATAPEGPWCKAAAVTPAVAASAARIVVIADGDVILPGLRDAIAAVRAGAAWAMPHTNVCRLTPAATLEAFLLTSFPADLEQPAYRGVEGGGAVVLERGTYLDVPLDPRFVGWGQEDQAWGCALRAIHGPPHREPHDLIHLWHPPQARQTRKVGSPAGQQLHRRYLRAARTGNAAAVRAVLNEVTPCSAPS